MSQAPQDSRMKAGQDGRMGRMTGVQALPFEQVTGSILESPFTVRFRGQVVGEYRADMIVDGTVIVELKDFGTPRLEYKRCHP